MKTLVIREFGDYKVPDAICIDLEKTELKNCVGCWTCWWKTPGVCVYKDLENYYRGYVNADKAIFFAKLESGFVSNRLKTLFDRMIPLVLPYTTFAEGGTWHTPRYPKYPDIVFYYDYDFQDKEDAGIFHDYIQRVFTQFYSKEICIRHISAYQECAR